MTNEPDIRLHSTPTIIFVEDCYLPQSVKMVEERLKFFESEHAELETLIFRVFGEIAKTERSLN